VLQGVVGSDIWHVVQLPYHQQRQDNARGASLRGRLG